MFLVGRIQRWSLLSLLAMLDKKTLYHSSPELAAYYLNVMYESIRAMEPSQVMSEPAKEHLLSALENRMSYTYCILFPNDATMDDLRPLDLGMLRSLSWFRSTTRLLPPGYNTCSPIHVDNLALRTHRTSSGSTLETSRSGDCPSWLWRDPLLSLKTPFPNLLAYVPARFLAAFGFDAEMVCQKGQDINDPHHCYIEHAEKWLKDEFMSNPGPLLQILIPLTPIALSIGIKAIVDELVTTKYGGGRELEMLYLVIVISGITLNNFIRDMVAQVRAGEGLIFQESSLGLSMILQIWAEETSLDQKLKPGNADMIKAFWDSDQPAKEKRLFVSNG
jgi:hypothetical protein